MKRYIGLMSGTSMDGIDAALVDVETQELIHGMTMPYSASVKAALDEFYQHSEHPLEKVYQLNTLIGRDFAKATEALLAASQNSPQDIIAIGSHGQTIIHDAHAAIPYTVQLGCPHTIAQLTGIPVVADFRTRDLVVGGQGAPLAPLYHQVLFAALEPPLAVVNIGGIANVSFLTGDGNASGYDVGPGNCLMDAWVKKHLGKSYDHAGEWASTGKVIEELLAQLMADPFIQKASPKSIGKEYYALDWLTPYLDEHMDAVDIQRTLLQLTALVIAKSIHDSKHKVRQVLVCGGGAHNHLLMSELEKLLKPINTQSTDKFGVNPDFIEAQMMAWLAAQMIDKKPLNLGKITGARQKAILGVFYPAGIDN